MITSRSDHTATLLPDGQSARRGAVVRLGALTVKAELYDPIAGTWARRQPAHGADYQHRDIAAQWSRAGCGRLGDPGAACELGAFRSATGNWMRTGSSISTASVTHGDSAAQWKGSSRRRLRACRYPRPSAELYDPASGTWTSPAVSIRRRTLSTPRHCCRTARSWWLGAYDSDSNSRQRGTLHTRGINMPATSGRPCQLVVGRQDSGRRARHKSRRPEEWSVVHTRDGWAGLSLRWH